MRTLRRLRIAALAVASLGAALAPRAAAAQNLGPFRQFLAVEPYYDFTRLDAGPSNDKVNTSGFGARLWLNAAPFGISDKVGVGLFYSFAPRQQGREVTLMQYGGQLEIFPVHRPLGGVIDPFVTAGASAFRVNSIVNGEGNEDHAVTRLAVTPGAGIRIPIPNRFQLRFDVRDAMVLRSTLGSTDGSSRTANNLELQGALGLTF